MAPRSSIGERVAYLEGIVPTIQSDVSGIKSDIHDVKKKVDQLEDRVTELLVKMGLIMTLVIPFISWLAERLFGNN